MNLFFVNQWETNKNELRLALEKTKCVSSYEKLVKLLFELVITKADEDDDYSDGWNYEDLIVVDHGDYQGTQLFIIPKDTYQPSCNDYCVTNVSYGSCSVCDTMEGILSDYQYDEDEEELDTFSKDQIDQLMTLALHIVQSLKFIYE